MVCCELGKLGIFAYFSVTFWVMHNFVLQKIFDLYKV